MSTASTIKEMNARNRTFWEEQYVLMKRRLADMAVAQTVCRRIAEYERSQAPVHRWKQFEALVEEVDLEKQRFLSEQGRSGGRARKTDTLQELVLDQARKRPNITGPELLERLRRVEFRAVISDIEKGTISSSPSRLSPKKMKIT